MVVATPAGTYVDGTFGAGGSTLTPAWKGSRITRSDSPSRRSTRRARADVRAVVDRVASGRDELVVERLLQPVVLGDPLPDARAVGAEVPQETRALG